LLAPPPPETNAKKAGIPEGRMIARK